MHEPSDPPAGSGDIDLLMMIQMLREEEQRIRAKIEHLTGLLKDKADADIDETVN